MPSTWVHVAYPGSRPLAKHVSTCNLSQVGASCQTREYMELILGQGLMPSTWVHVTYPGSGLHAKHVSTWNLYCVRASCQTREYTAITKSCLSDQNWSKNTQNVTLLEIPLYVVNIRILTYLIDMRTFYSDLLEFLKILRSIPKQVAPNKNYYLKPRGNVTRIPNPGMSVIGPQ